MLQHAALVGLRREAGARLLPALARGVASWAKFDPTEMSGTKPAQVSNLGEPPPPPPAAAACWRCRCIPNAASLTLPLRSNRPARGSFWRLGAVGEGHGDP